MRHLLNPRTRTTPLRAQQPFDLSVRNIMRGPELYGREPSQVRFTADDRWIHLCWLPAGSKWNEDLKPFRVAARDNRPEVLAANGDITTFTPAANRKPSDVPDYISTDGYARMIPGRTKVGDAQGSQKVGHLDLASGDGGHAPVIGPNGIKVRR